MVHALLRRNETVSMEYIKCFWKQSVDSLWIPLGKLHGGRMSVLRVSLCIMYISAAVTGYARDLRGKNV